MIDQDKAKIAELKKKLSATHNKEVQAQFETIQKNWMPLTNPTRPLFLKETNCVTKELKSKSKRMPNMSKLEKLEVTLMKNLLLLETIS